MTHTSRLRFAAQRLEDLDRIGLLHELAEDLLGAGAPDLEHLEASVSAGEISEASAVQDIYTVIVEVFILRLIESGSTAGFVGETGEGPTRIVEVRLPSDDSLPELFALLRDPDGTGEAGYHARTLRALSEAFGPVDWERVEESATNGVKYALADMREIVRADANSSRQGLRS